MGFIKGRKKVILAAAGILLMILCGLIGSRTDKWATSKVSETSAAKVMQRDEMKPIFEGTESLREEEDGWLKEEAEAGKNLSAVKQQEAEPGRTDVVKQESSADEQTSSEQITIESVAGEPVSGESDASEPVVSEPVASEPVASEPVASESITVEPVTGTDCTHDFEKSIWENPTCMKGGYYNNICRNCGLVECVSLEALPHEQEDITVQEGNCMEDTVIRHICKNCGQQVGSDTRFTPQIHEWVTEVIEGKEITYCNRCGIV